MMSRNGLVKVFAAISVAIVLSLVGYDVLRSYLSDEDRLVSKFRSDLVSRDFKTMYRDSSDFMKLNVSEEEFSHRMTVVIQTLEEYDPDVDFHRNLELEDFVKKVRNDSDPEHTHDGSTYSVFVYLDVGHAEKTGTISISWIRQGIRPRLFDLSIGDSDKSMTNRITSLAGEPFRAGS